MTYTYLTMEEFACCLESYSRQDLKVYQITEQIGRSNEPVYKVLCFP